MIDRIDRSDRIDRIAGPRASGSGPAASIYNREFTTKNTENTKMEKALEKSHPKAGSARNPSFVASFVWSFVDKARDKARDKDAMQMRRISQWNDLTKG